MAAVTTGRKPASGELEELRAELAGLRAENTALARAVSALAVRVPGSPATALQILTSQLGLGAGTAAAIIAAAERTGS